jgi:PAS domain S-box-containing protein
MKNLLTKGLTVQDLDNILLHSPAILYSCEARAPFQFTYLSKNVERILGYSPEEFVNDPHFWMNHLLPNEMQNILNDLDQLFETNTNSCTYQFRAANHEYKWFRDDFSLIRDVNGAPLKIFGCMLDVTHEKELEIEEIELFEAHEKLEEKEREISLLNARLEERRGLLQDVHDGFGSQLSTARILARERKLSHEDFDRILTECLLDLHLVCDTLMIENASICDALIDYKYRLQHRVDSTKVSLHWTIDLPNELLMNSRKILSIMRILQESVSNALNHSQAKNIWITLQFHSESSLLTLKVKDDGCGFKEGYRKGHGINNMFARAKQLGGTLDMKNDTVHGATVEFSICLLQLSQTKIE